MDGQLALGEGIAAVANRKINCAGCSFAQACLQQLLAPHICSCLV